MRLFSPYLELGSIIDNEYGMLYKLLRLLSPYLESGSINGNEYGMIYNI